MLQSGHTLLNVNCSSGLRVGPARLSPTLRIPQSDSAGVQGRLPDFFQGREIVHDSQLNVPRFQFSYQVAQNVHTRGDDSGIRNPHSHVIDILELINRYMVTIDDATGETIQPRALDVSNSTTVSRCAEPCSSILFTRVLRRPYNNAWTFARKEVQQLMCLVRCPDEWPVQPFLPCWPINSDTNGAWMEYRYGWIVAKVKKADCHVATRRFQKNMTRSVSSKPRARCNACPSRLSPLVSDANSAQARAEPHCSTAVHNALAMPSRRATGMT